MTEETKHPGGRPTKFKPEYCEQARKLSLLGLTDTELAEFFEVNEDTVHEWKKVHPEFSESLRAGKTKADAEIAHSLHDRAKGAEWTEEQPFKVKNITYENGKKVSETEEVITVTVKKKAPPDTQAASLWLRNRRSSKWRDTQHVEQTVMPKEAPTEFASPEEAAAAYSEFIKK